MLTAPFYVSRARAATGASLAAAEAAVTARRAGERARETPRADLHAGAHERGCGAADLRVAHDDAHVVAAVPHRLQRDAGAGAAIAERGPRPRRFPGRRRRVDDDARAEREAGAGDGRRRVLRRVPDAAPHEPGAPLARPRR